MLHTSGEPADDGWDDWAPQAAADEGVAMDGDDWGSFESAQPPDWDRAAIPVTSADPQPAGISVPARSPRVLREHRQGGRAQWPSALLLATLVAMVLAGLALYSALHHVDVLDPRTVSDAGFLLLATVLLSGVVIACLMAAVVALVRRRSVWRAAATLVSGLIVAPVVLYFAMVQGMYALQDHAGQRIMGYVPGSVTDLHELAVENGVELGWLGTILEMVGGF